MQNIKIRVLTGLVMLASALLFTGMLASALEQRAQKQHPVDETFMPPKSNWN